MIASRATLDFLVATKPSVRPEIDERVDVRVDGIRRNVQHVMQKHVRVNRSHEESRRRTRISEANHACLGGAAEVVLDDLDAAARRTVFALCQRTRVHEDDDVLREDMLCERDELLGDAPQNDARVGRGCVDRRQLHDEWRRLDGQMHCLGEESVLRPNVTKDRRRRDVQFAGDISQRRPFKAFLGEDASRHGEQLVSRDRRRPAHL